MRIGIDLGGSKIEGVVLADDGQIAQRIREPTPPNDYEQVLHTVAGIVSRLEQVSWSGLRVGVGTPGTRSRVTGEMKNCNNTCLNGRPLQQDLEGWLARPVRIANDANCFALSESSDGAGAGADVVFGVILGTGVGGGLVVRGQVVDGPNGICGEWGHNPLMFASDDRPIDSRSCYCGRYDCVETWLSGPGLERSYLEIAGVSRSGLDIALEAQQEPDSVADLLLERYSRRLASALGVVINVLDPDVIVLGGGLSNIHTLYERVPRYLEQFVFSDRVDTQLRQAQHGDSSGVRGAAWLWAPGE